MPNGPKKLYQILVFVRAMEVKKEKRMKKSKKSRCTHNKLKVEALDKIQIIDMCSERYLVTLFLI